MLVKLFARLVTRFHRFDQIEQNKSQKLAIPRTLDLMLRGIVFFFCIGIITIDHDSKKELGNTTIIRLSRAKSRAKS